MSERTAADMEVHDHLEDAAIEAEKLLGVRPSDDEQSVEVVEDEALEATEESEEESVEETEEAPEDEDFIPRADLESLLEGVTDEDSRERIITAYKSFQRSATKRNQEVSELTRTFQGIDPSAAREAYDFLESLKTDRAFATEVRDQLIAALEDEGATPAQAKRQATQMVQDAQTESDEFSEWGLDKDNPLVKEIEESRRFRQQAEQFFAAEAEERQRQALYAEAAEQDAKIRAANPKYTDENMEDIYRLATSFGGSLEQAAEYYEGLRARERTEYVASKKAPKGVGPLPGGSAHGEQPIEIKSVNDAHEVALRMLKEGNIPD